MTKYTVVWLRSVHGEGPAIGDALNGPLRGGTTYCTGLDAWVPGVLEPTG